MRCSFTDTSTGNPSSWSWSFGDGGSATDENPSHSYTAPGVYSVSLTATNAAGANTCTKLDYIAAGAGGAHPSANLNLGPGPAHPCGASSSGPSVGGSGGQPAEAINTFTGNLTIGNIGVTYASVGDAIPFQLVYNSQSVGSPYVRASGLSPGWTHSYNVYIVDRGGDGAIVVEGNGWEHWFAWNGSAYQPPDGVFDVLARTHAADGTWTGWVLARPDRHQYFFDTNGKLTSIQDRDGLTWTLSYGDYWGNLTIITDPMNRQTTLSYVYTYGDLLQSVQAPGGLSLSLSYDYDLLRCVQNAAGETYNFLYSGSDPKVTGIQDVYPSREVNYTYGTSNGAPVLASTAVNGAPATLVTYTYSTPQGAAGPLETDTTEFVNYNGGANGVTRTTSQFYQKADDPANALYAGELLSVVADPGGIAATQTWAYDANLRPIAHQDSFQPESGGKDHIDRYYYTDQNSPTKVTKYIDPENYDSALGDASPGTCYTYDGLGNLTRAVSPAGRETDYTYYQGTNRLYQATLQDQDVNGNAVARTTTYTYTDASLGYQVQTGTDANGHTTSYAYDATTGYLTSVTSPLGDVTSYAHDDAGNVTSIEDANGNIAWFEYDGLHRVTQTTYPDVGNGVSTVTTVWSPAGATQVTDENGVVTKYDYDPHTYRPTAITQDYGTNPLYENLNLLTQYSYDDAGDLTAVTDARGKTTHSTYDTLGRVTAVSYPDGTSASSTYRDDGRLWTSTDGRGLTTTYCYDADDRLASVGGAPAVAYPNDPAVSLTRDVDGLVTSTRDASGSASAVSSTYYPSGLPKTVTGYAGASQTLTYQYDGVGQVTALTLPDSTSFTYAYTARNQLASVTNPDGVTVGFAYDPGGRRTQVTRPAGAISYSYNARDWLTAVQNRATDDTVLYDASYSYQCTCQYTYATVADNTGNPLYRAETVNGDTLGTTYAYDHLYRLTQEWRSDATYPTVYSYDQVGNRTCRGIVNGAAVYYSYDDNNKLLSASDGSAFAYDLNGNLTSVTGPLGPGTLLYDDQNRLTSDTYPGTGGPLTNTYAYNAAGLRTLANLAGTSYWYLYNGERVARGPGQFGQPARPLYHRGRFLLRLPAPCPSAPPARAGSRCTTASARCAAWPTPRRR